MNQPPEPSDPEGPQHAESSPLSGGPPQEETSGRSDTGTRLNPALVALALVVLALLLSLGAFFGVRTVLGANDGGQGISAVQHESPAPQEWPGVV